MNKKMFLGTLLTVIFSILIVDNQTVQAANSPFPLPLSPKVDKVRDEQGNPLKNNNNYRIKVFSTDSTNKKGYYIYDSYDGSTYDWLWLTPSGLGALSIQINNLSEILTDGKQVYIIKGADGEGEIVRFQNDGTYSHGGLYWGGNGHGDRYGFRRIEGDRDYKYLLTNNYGAIFADFSKKSLTTLSTDDYFIISFVKV